MEHVKPDIYRHYQVDQDEDTRVIVPYVHGMMRHATWQAVTSWGGNYEAWSLNAEDPTSYAMHFEKWWQSTCDLIIVEQDVIPDPGMIEEMAMCRNQWCLRPYHVGNGQYATGLGMCKISEALRNTHPNAGVNIARDPTGREQYINYLSLNEAMLQHLGRLKVTACLHPEPVRHLHYPAAHGG